MNTKDYIANKIRELRIDAGLKQSELGAMLTPPKGPGTVSSWEKGRTAPDADTLMSLCDALNVSIFDFYPPREDKTDNTIRPDEMDLLSLFRACDAHGKKVILAVARGMAAHEE